MRKAPTPAPLFSEAELLDDLTGMHVGLNKAAGVTHASSPSNVVLDGEIFSSEKAFDEFMDSLASLPTDDDVKSTTVSEDGVSESASASPPPSGEETGAGKKKRNLETAAQKPSVGKPQPKRRRRKEELDRLRAVAAELEKKLNVVNRSSSSDQPGTDQFWRRVSGMMMSGRQKAVVENARLREMVKEQVKSVRAMQRVLGNTPDLTKMGFAPMRVELDQAAHSRIPSKKECHGLFKNIAYRDTANLSVKTDIPTPTIEGTRKMSMELEMVPGGGPRMCLEFVESKLVLFDFLRAGDHAWDFLSGTNGLEDFQMVLQRQGNEMFGQTSARSPSGSARLLGNIAVRRYREPNKLRLVWECDGDCPHSNGSMRIRQKGWCEFELVKQGSKSVTTFRSCGRLTPSLPVTESVVNMTEAIIQCYEMTMHTFDAVRGNLEEEEEEKSRAT